MQGPKWPFILLACGPCVVVVNCWDRFCTLGRASRIKETLPDFMSGVGLLNDIYEYSAG